HFPNKNKQKQKRSVSKDDKVFMLEVQDIKKLFFLVIKQNGKKRKYSQKRGSNIPDYRIFFELMRIKPDQENISRKKQSSPPRNQKSKSKNHKVYSKINF